MSGDSIAMVTILSSDNEDVQEVQEVRDKIATNCRGDPSTSKRRVPIQRIATGKEIFSEFVEKCQSYEKSVEMEKITKKMWKRFNEAEESYIKSSFFKELVLKARDDIDSKLYSTIKAVCDELSSNKKTQSRPTLENSLPSTSASASVDDNDQGVDPKTLLHIKKLEKLLTNIHRRIQKLDNVDVDLYSSDEENSAYVQVARYKQRFCQVFQKLCEMKNKDPHAERALKKHIKFSATQIPEVDRAIEKFYNDQREFPDYRDILTVVKKANEVKKLNLNSAEITGLALRAFQELGKTLKRYRQLDDVEIFRSYISDNEDPAAKDVSLEKTLEENTKKYGNRIDEVIDKYAVMQDEQRLEPAEVDSDVEDEEDTECEEDLDSDDESRSSILESKSDLEDSADDVDYRRYPDCRVVLPDVKYSSAWEQYVLRKQAQSIKCESLSNTDSVPRPILAVKRSSKRRSESESEETSSDSTEYPIEPIPSTSKQFVPIKLGHYRHIKRAKVEKLDESTQDESNKTTAEETVEKMLTENDSDVIEVISDSCEKNVIKVNDGTVERDETNNVPNESTSNDHAGNVSNDDDEMSFSNNNNFACSTQIFDKACVETLSNENDDLPASPEFSGTADDNHKNSKISSSSSSSSTSQSVSKADDDTKNKLPETRADSKSSPTGDIIDVDMEDQKSTSEQHELLNNVDHFMCNGDTLPLEVVLDEDSSKTTKSIATRSRSKTAKGIDNDDIVVIEEIVNSKTPTKVSNDVIDIEEISDSPEQPKPTSSKGVRQAVNLTQIIRNMNFKPETIPKNRMIAGSSKPVTMPGSNISQVKQGYKGRGIFPNLRQMAQNTASASSRTFGNFPNMVRTQTHPFFNQRQSVNGRQFASMQTRNVQNVQYMSNNANVTMKSSQAAMQRRQFTERTVQTFDAKNNRVITRKEITTVVQQSVMQVVGQNQRLVNRQMQHINRQRISSNRSSSSDDVITLD